MAKGGSSTTQEQTVQQSTNVQVTTVVQGRELEPLEKLNLLADIFTKLDAAEVSRRTAGTPSTVLSVNTIPGLAVLQNPQTVLLLTGAAALLIMLSKRRF